jgi:hypothetical protein
MMVVSATDVRRPVRHLLHDQAEVQGKVVVGHVGDHLDVITTT